MIPCEYFVGFDFLSILLHYNQPGKNSLQYWGIKLSWILKRWLLQFPRLRATTIPSIWWSRNFVAKFWQLFGAVLQLYPTVAYSSWPPKTTQFSGGSLFSSLTIYSLILCILICPLDFQVELVSLNFQNILYIGEFARGRVIWSQRWLRTHSFWLSHLWNMSLRVQVPIIPWPHVAKKSLHNLELG